jgi:hypothetical protein
MSLPGYDAWKTRSPDEFAPEQELAFELEHQDAEDNLRAAIAATLTDERGQLYLADIRKVVIEELNKLTRQPGEPEWQTKTPVPIPALG